MSISPDKKDIYITVNLTEGRKYKVSDIRFAGDLIVPEAQLRKLLKLKKGEVFSREKLTESTKLIVDRLGNEGYAFANVNPVPEPDREKGEVAFTLYVDPGRRVYVRRINIGGNTTTRDEVIRREMRQLEGGYYSAEKLQRSKQRIDKLGFFSEVTVDTVNVPGVPGSGRHQRQRGRASDREPAVRYRLLDLGRHHPERLGGAEQPVRHGQCAVAADQHRSGEYRLRGCPSPIRISPTTASGLGVDLYLRNVDSTSLNVGRTRRPRSARACASWCRSTRPTPSTMESPPSGPTSPRSRTARTQYINFVNEFGNSNTSLPLTAGWTRDRRNSAIFTSSGTLQNANLEVAVPPAELRYYRAQYQIQWYIPVSIENVLQLTGKAGYASGYSGLPLPFYKNFYLGGIGSVRGYDTASIGPQDSQGNALGGNMQLIGNVEYYFPFPGLQKDKSVRLSAFLDVGALGDTSSEASSQGLGSTSEYQARASVGVALAWFSPVGPLKISYAFPLNKQPGDKTQPFQFQLGTTF